MNFVIGAARCADRKLKSERNFILILKPSCLISVTTSANLQMICPESPCLRHSPALPPIECHAVRVSGYSEKVLKHILWARNETAKSAYKPARQWWPISRPAFLR